MGIIARAAKFFGYITVKENSNTVKITGIDGFIMSRYIKDIWATNIYTKMMFTSITDTSISLPSFFIPDFVYMLSELRQSKKVSWAGRRTIDKIIHGILTNTWFKMSVGPVETIIDLKRLSLLRWKPLSHQLEFLEAFGDRMPRYGLRGMLLASLPGSGKAITLSSLIRTPSGWVRNGDIKLSQEIVTPDGRTGKVIGIYPQGVRDTYRITFEDGRSVACDDDHLWKVTYKHWYHTDNPWRVYSLKELRIALEVTPSYIGRLYIPLIEPEIKADVDLPIDPYVLGVLLGDGSITDDTICICKPDQFIKDEVSRLLPDYVKLSDWYSDNQSYRININESTVEKSIRRHNKTKPRFIQDLVDLGLIGTYSDTKFIPEIYMNASPRQRMSLVQGLMDTNGYCSPVGLNRNGTMNVNGVGGTEYCTTSPVLANQFQELIRSLGGLCKLKEKIPYYTYEGERKQGKLAHILRPRMRNPSDLFRLPRKKENATGEYQYGGDNLKLRIKSIEYVGKEETQCIEVDHPDHLYITDDYIVTHNTFMDLTITTCVVPPSVAEVKIIISPKKALHLVWENTIDILFKKRPTHWVCDSGLPMPLKHCEYYIFNYERLEDAVALGRYLISNKIRYFVSVDESHNFADPRSARTKELVKLTTLKDNIYSIWMSGSPILKKGAELVSFLKASDNRFDSEAERRFSRIYASSPGRAGEIFNHRLGKFLAFIPEKIETNVPKPIIKELPVKLPDALANRFLMSSVRVEMKEFIKTRLEYYGPKMKEYREYVDKVFSKHERTLKTRSERKLFEEYKMNVKIISRNPDVILVETNAAAKNYEHTNLLPSMPPHERKEFRKILSAIKNIKLKVRGEALGTILSRRRAECAAALGVYCKPENIIKESNSKTLFFSASILPIKAVEDYLKKKGFYPLLVYGSTNKDLTNIIREFDTNPDANPICATFQSLSEAVPVTAASTIVFLNRPFRQALREQVIARSARISQLYQVVVWDITLDTGGEPNVSSTTDAILAAVREDINILVGPEFAGGDPSETEYQEVLDRSKENPNVRREDESIGLI